jgi:hypothetical protein
MHPDPNAPDSEYLNFDKNIGWQITHTENQSEFGEPEGYGDPGSVAPSEMQWDDEGDEDEEEDDEEGEFEEDEDYDEYVYARMSLPSTNKMTDLQGPRSCSDGANGRRCRGRGRIRLGRGRSDDVGR